MDGSPKRKESYVGAEKTSTARQRLQQTPSQEEANQPLSYLQSMRPEEINFDFIDDDEEIEGNEVSSPEGEAGEHDKEAFHKEDDDFFFDFDAEEFAAFLAPTLHGRPSIVERADATTSPASARSAGPLEGLAEAQARGQREKKKEAHGAPPDEAAVTVERESVDAVIGGADRSVASGSLSGSEAKLSSGKLRAQMRVKADQAETDEDPTFLPTEPETAALQVSGAELDVDFWAELGLSQPDRESLDTFDQADSQKVNHAESPLPSEVGDESTQTKVARETLADGDSEAESVSFESEIEIEIEIDHAAFSSEEKDVLASEDTESIDLDTARLTGSRSASSVVQPSTEVQQLPQIKEAQTSEKSKEGFKAGDAEERVKAEEGDEIDDLLSDWFDEFIDDELEERALQETPALSQSGSSTEVSKLPVAASSEIDQVFQDAESLQDSELDEIEAFDAAYDDLELFREVEQAAGKKFIQENQSRFDLQLEADSTISWRAAEGGVAPKTGSEKLDGSAIVHTAKEQLGAHKEDLTDRGDAATATRASGDTERTHLSEDKPVNTASSVDTQEISKPSVPMEDKEARARFIDSDPGGPDHSLLSETEEITFNEPLPQESLSEKRLKVIQEDRPAQQGPLSETLLSSAQGLAGYQPAEVLPSPAQEIAELRPVRPLFTPPSRLQSASSEPDQAEGIRRHQRDGESAVSEYTLPSPSLSEPRRRARPPWEILLLEGDRGLVRQIQSAFEQLQVMEKTAKVTHVGSAEEAQVLLSMRDNFALFIADVSLLEERGGLAFLRWLRAQSSLQSLRIVLRTEEAGSAPNPKLLKQLSVSDYWPRRELTIHRVQLQSAELIQSYHNQRYFERQRVVLQQMIGCVGLLRAEQGLSQLLSQLIDLIEPQLAGKNTVLIFFQLTKNRRLGEGILLGGTGPYQNQQPRPLNELLPRERLKTLEESFRTRQFVRHNGTMSFLKIARSGQGCALIVREIGGMSRWVERSLMTLCESTLRLISEQLLNHQRQRQISAAERFIPRELVSWFGRRSALDLELGDFQRCRGWVLCCELSGLHDLNAAPEVERLLLKACQLILPCVKKHGGIFDKAVGGQIIAHFPSQLAPLPCCRELGALLQLEGDGLQVNLGLHGGELLLCTVGHKERLEITVISEVVQLASRLCALAREFSCFSLASDLVLAAAPEDSRAWLRAVGRYQGPETRGRLPLFQVLTPVESRESAPEEELSPLLELLYSGDAEVGEQLQHLAGSYPADRLLPVLIDHFVSRPAWS